MGEIGDIPHSSHPHFFTTAGAILSRLRNAKRRWRVRPLLVTMMLMHVHALASCRWCCSEYARGWIRGIAMIDPRGVMVLLARSGAIESQPQRPLLRQWRAVWTIHSPSSTNIAVTDQRISDSDRIHPIRGVGQIRGTDAVAVSVMVNDGRSLRLRPGVLFDELLVCVAIALGLGLMSCYGKGTRDIGGLLLDLGRL